MVVTISMAIGMDATSSTTAKLSASLTEVPYSSGVYICKSEENDLKHGNYVCKSEGNYLLQVQIQKHNNTKCDRNNHKI